MAWSSLLAIDVGSSCIKLGWFPPPTECPGPAAERSLPIAAPALPLPQEVFEAPHRDRSPAAWLAEIESWIDQLPVEGELVCAMASVHLAAAGSLEESLRLSRGRRLIAVKPHDVPIEARVKQPSRVGVDRLLGALAVNRLRRPGAPAISVDMGTAATVDLVGADGAFEGGAILAGPMLSLAALHGGTASLPRLDRQCMAQPPAPVGKSTIEAMASGAYWGAAGAVSELVRRIAETCDSPPDVFLTGGAAAGFASFIGLAGQRARHVPHLVLGGIYLAAHPRLVAS